MRTMHGWYYLAPQDDNVETLHQIHLHHREPGYLVNRTFLVPPFPPASVCSFTARRINRTIFPWSVFLSLFTLRLSSRRLL